MISVIIIEQENLSYDEHSNWMTFNIGTCCGYFGEDEFFTDIFMITNMNKGNGDFDLTVKWFEERCLNNGKKLLFSAIENKRLLKHLINKRGFTLIGNIYAEKTYDKSNINT